MQSAHLNKVVVRVPNWVGDAVMALPALRALRANPSIGYLALLARPWVAGLFEQEAIADQIILTHGSSPRRFIADAKRLRREQFDMAILLPNAFGAALLARAAGIRRVAGYPTDRRRPLLSTVVPFDPEIRKSHQVLYYLGIVTGLNRLVFDSESVHTGPAIPALTASTEQLARAVELLSRHGIDLAVSAPKGEPGQRPSSDQPSYTRPLPAQLGNAEGALTQPASRLLALNPGATNSRAKLWLPERFAAVADRLVEEGGFQTIIIGSAADGEVAARVASSMRSKAVVLAGRTTISELKGILAWSSLVISNDTGAAHVSAALGIPTVVVFGPTEHFCTHPFSDLATVVRQDVECSPCMLRDCPIDHRCMTGVECEDVYRAAERLLRIPK